MSEQDSALSRDAVSAGLAADAVTDLALILPNLAGAGASSASVSFVEAVTPTRLRFWQRKKDARL